MADMEAEFWKRQYVARRISRREFIGRVGALGLTAAVSGSILSAGSQARAQTPQRGGRLRLGWYLSGAGDNLSFTRAANTLEFTRLWQVGSNLVRYSKNLTPEPDLATEWEANNDLTQWKFKIRDGVEFHNGKSLTLDDIIYSLNLHRGENTDSAISAYFSSVTDIRKDGDDVIVIELSAPNADLPMYLGDVHTVIAPDGYDDWRNFVGTGPFKLRRFEPGVEMLVERFENFYGTPAHVDEVSTIGIPDASARLNALISGDVDYIVRVEPNLVGAVEQSPGVSMAAAKSGRRITFPMQVDAAPFDNHDFRLAIKHMADRQGMVDTVLRGYGTVGNDNPIAPTDRYVDPDLEQREMDLDKARFHLQRSGLEGQTVTLHMSDAAGGSIAPSLALHLRETAAQAGLNIDLRREPSDGYWTNVWLRRPFHMGHLVPRPTADLTLSLIYHSNAAWNETQFRDAELDKLIEEARATPDGPERHELYKAAQRIIHDQAGTLIPVHPDWLDARSDKVQGWSGDPVGEAEGFRISETVWLDS